MFLDNPQVVVVLMQVGGDLSRGQKGGTIMIISTAAQAQSPAN